MHAIQLRTILTKLTLRGLLAPESAAYISSLPPATPMVPLDGGGNAALPPPLADVGGPSGLAAPAAAAAAAAAGYGAGAPAAAHAMPPPVDFGASGFRVGSRSLEGLHFQAHLDALEAGIGPNADVSTMLPGSASLDNALGVGVGSLDGDALQMFADSYTNFVDNTSGRLSVGNLPVGNNGSFSVDNRTPAPYPVNAGIPQQPAGEVKVDSQP